MKQRQSGYLPAGLGCGSLLFGPPALLVLLTLSGKPQAPESLVIALSWFLSMALLALASLGVGFRYWLLRDRQPATWNRGTKIGIVIGALALVVNIWLGVTFAYGLLP